MQVKKKANDEIQLYMRNLYLVKVFGFLLLLNYLAFPAFKFVFNVGSPTIFMAELPSPYFGWDIATYIVAGCVASFRITACIDLQAGELSYQAGHWLIFRPDSETFELSDLRYIEAKPTNWFLGRSLVFHFNGREELQLITDSPPWLTFRKTDLNAIGQQVADFTGVIFKPFPR